MREYPRDGEAKGQALQADGELLLSPPLDKAGSISHDLESRADINNGSSPGPHLTLPQGFPQDTKKPKFGFGERVHWHSVSTQDYGTVVGMEYAPDNHQHLWNWRYTVQLDRQSPSSTICSSDWAWENDLEQFLGAEPQASQRDGQFSAPGSAL
ncbi:hypothetical protein [Leptolyngbya sp. FACHB-261]|uniref:hypothetical protein n=1 Tax=Leptolyngbya sp. FACHB-261 TaxID=2692806 RepID=UPI001683C642|nr:hypothetical protein [Leptolyngbya sp. FACHB-261]MBD2101011.1 hypothetical protein [Leptolyngbya sp. FACHB-261]